MKCPVDNATLVMTSRDGVEIDYCPECRGVWLDRGELDKIIDRSSGSARPEPRHHDAPAPRPDRGDYYRDDHHDKGYHKKRKKESFLGDLFDF